MIWLLACVAGPTYPAGLVGDRDTDPGPDGDSAAADTSVGDSAADGDTAADTAADTAVDTAADTAADTGEIQGDPCAPILPETTQVVQGDATLAEDGVVALVCRAATLSAAGHDGRFFVEDRGDLVLSGSGGRVWAIGSARVSVYGGSTEVYVEEGVDVFVDPYLDAGDVVVTTCSTLAFVGGPASGC